MDDVLRRCISGSSALVLIMLLFLLTAIESSILDCSENKLRSLLSESKNRRAERLLRLKDRRQAVKVTGIVERCLLTAAVCFM